MLKKKGTPLPVRQEAALLLERRGSYLVRRRPATGLLGGLWEFPTVSLAAKVPAQQQLRTLLHDFGVAGELLPLGGISHIYSHFRLELQLFKLAINDLPRVAEGETAWCAEEELSELALHGAHKKALTKLPGAGD